MRRACSIGNNQAADRAPAGSGSGGPPRPFSTLVRVTFTMLWTLAYVLTGMKKRLTTVKTELT
jgi:hypothetical protein